MTKTKTLALLLATAASFSLPVFAADTAAKAGAAVTKDEAKSMKAHSEAEFKAQKNVAEANEDLAKGDCKAGLDGSAKRACDKAAKAAAKSDKAAAKATHEVQEKAIDAAKK
jgi:hypothetical protein